MTTAPDRQTKACTLDFDEGRVHGVMRVYQSVEGERRAYVVVLRMMMPDAAIARYFKHDDDIALNVSVPLNDPRLTILDSHPKAAYAIHAAVSKAFFTNAYQWEVTRAGLRRIVENIEGLSFSTMIDPIVFKLEVHRPYLTLENMPVRLIDGSQDQIRLAGVMNIDVLPDWSVVVDGEALL